MNTDKSPELQDAISFDDFMGVELRVGTVIEAVINQKAKKPAYVLNVDFGPYGIKTVLPRSPGIISPKTWWGSR